MCSFRLGREVPSSLWKEPNHVYNSGVLKLECVPESSERFVDTDCRGPPPRFLIGQVCGGGLRTDSSNKCPGDTDAAGPETTGSTSKGTELSISSKLPKGRKEHP